MRSSKSRSRNKSNRNRSMGNVVNRVFDSSGPEGKVRGTPQQIIEKYTQLARDAALSNDRVAAENFQQHAEHYTRMLGEALREQEARREQESQSRGGRPQRDQNDGSSGQQDDPGSAPQPEARGPDIVDVPERGDSGLVETPEMKAVSEADATPRRPRRPRKPRGGGANPDSGNPPQEAAE